MAENYFTSENAWKHLFFVQGLTADEFYTDSGMRLDIEQLTQMELKKSGYERIVFYDTDNKIYCYDEESFALLRENGRTRKKAEASSSEATSSKASAGRKGGLKRGRHAHRVSGKKEEAQKTPEEKTTAAGSEKDSLWELGEKSGLMIRRMKAETLHLGMRDSVFIKRQIDAYMTDSLIKTAVVINDPTEFLREFGADPIHSLTVGYERMSSDNENILVFLYKDGDLGNIYESQQLETEGKNMNLIHISCPNAAELRNMLMYFRLQHGLKFAMRELSALSLSLCQAMSVSEKRIRIKDLYKMMRKYDTSRPLTQEGCYELLGVKRPVPAEKQLQSLIGMSAVKEALSAYDTGNTAPYAQLQYQTSSRLQPDLPRPEKKNEMIHFVLTGNPGVGKTTVAKLIGQLFYEMGYLDSGHVVETDRSELVAGYVGQTAIRTRNAVERAMGGVLFIDEAYTLKRQKETGNDFGQEAIDTLVKLMDQYKGRFIVVAAGYPREMKTFIESNPGLSGRFKTISIEDYTGEEMQKILAFHAGRKQAGFSESFRGHLADFCENWVDLADENWQNAREAVNLIDDMLRNWQRDEEAKQQGDVKVLEEKHLPPAYREYLRPVAEMREEVLRQLQGMTGLSGVKKAIEKLRKRMIAGDQDFPGHYLFLGNPGTGKTTIARYMGRILRNLKMLKRGHMVEYTAADLMSEVFNEENHGDFYQVAKKAMGGVLFIDEAHQLAEDTTGRGTSIFKALVPFMENNRKEICVIVAGYEESMDALLKTDIGFRNRFTETIIFENYSGEELRDILLGMLAERGIEADEQYREYALRALTRYVAVHGKEPDFGNARFIRTSFLPDTLDAQTNRLIDKYGEDFPREEKRHLTGEDIPEAYRRYIKTPLKKKKEDDKSALDEIDSLIGFEKVKKRLKDLLALKKTAEETGREDLLEDLNLHWVLRGNPGTGKTTVASLIGKVYKEMGLLSHGKTVKVTRTDLVAGYVGQTAEKTQKCIDKAMGGVLFIDEAYSLKRSEISGGDFGQESIDTLLEQMSARNGEFAVIAAGYPKEMQVFLDSNPGFQSRFDEDFLLEDYSAQELSQIFQLKCKKKKFHLDDEMTETVTNLFAQMIAEHRKNWANGREAENLEKRMRRLWALHPVTRTTEAGEKLSYYTREHIPEEYSRYLTESRPAGSETKEEARKTPQEEKRALSLSRQHLGKPEEHFDYEKSYLKQVESVVFIRVNRKDGMASGSGSFITDDGYILTCCHVIEGGQHVKVRLRKNTEEGGEVSWHDARIVWADRNLDAAVLKIEGEGFTALAMRNVEEKTNTGEAIYHWGYPFGGKLSDNLDELEPSLFQGYISSIQTKNGLKRINTNMEAKRGCSGGPVFSRKDGRIIGILCGSQTEGDSALMEEINYVLPVEYIWEQVISKEE